MIDLCIDARMAFSSGIGTYIRHIIPFLNQPPFRVLLLVDRLCEEWCKEFEQVLFSPSVYSLKEQIALPLKIPRCDLFWSPHYNIPLLPIRARKRIATIHDACHLALGRYLSISERIYAKIVMGQALHRSDAVITVSHFSKNELHRYLGPPKKGLCVIPLAVKRDQFQAVKDPLERNRIRRKYQLPEKFFLYVGNVKAHKNLSGLLEAFERLSLPDWGVVFVGKSSGFRNSIPQLVGSQVFALGEIPNEDLAALYSLAEVFVFPSFYEGFGFPPLEAMSCGCPTVVSTAGSIPEVCGEASLYFRPDQPEEIAEAMRKVISDQTVKEKLIQKGFDKVQTYSWEKTASQHLELFERVHGDRW